MDFGTFLLLQSPSARSSEEIFGRATEIAQAADRQGFESIWCAEHHFSTYGYLSRPLMLATHLAGKTERSTQIPFGPYLAAAGWMTLLWGDDLMRFYFSLFGL